MARHQPVKNRADHHDCARPDQQRNCKKWPAGVAEHDNDGICAGLDGIAIGADGHIYVDTFNGGNVFRIERKKGIAGEVTELRTSRALSLPDGLRHLDGQTFLMIEGTGKLDRITIVGDEVKVEPIKDGFKELTAFAKVGDTAWVAEGQLSHLFDVKTKGAPSLPFRVIPVHVGK